VYLFIHASLLKKTVIGKAFWIEVMMMTNENNNVPNSNALTSRPPTWHLWMKHTYAYAHEENKERKLDTGVGVVVIPWQLPH
jgi:hypothetical protein